MFEKSYEEELEAKHQAPVTCLGLKFENDGARREHFMGLLRSGLEELEGDLQGVGFTSPGDAVERMESLQKWAMGDDARLHDLAERMREASRQEPEKDLLQLWKDQVGFPHGEIEDILNLSDPPYYTACPNPFIEHFIQHYGKPYNPDKDDYRREPFAADVSEGKNDPIYRAHSYHTKVPHKAVMRYILHYTEPGDVVFDGFTGTGMTGVAAQLCGDRETVESLGYQVDEKGIIYQQETAEKGNSDRKAFSRLGARRAVLNDLSPAATFIAYNYNTPLDVQAFKREAKRILKEVEVECGWLYRTLHEPTEEQITAALSAPDRLLDRGPIEQSSDLPWAKIVYTVWSDVFVCSECSGKVVFWEVAVDKEAGKVHKEFPCPRCNAALTKRNMDRSSITKYDKSIGGTVRQAKQVPVLINYSVGKKRHKKTPDAFDLALIEKIEQINIPYWFPTDRMPLGYNTKQPEVSHGLTHVHHFYTKRNLWVLTTFAQKASVVLQRALWVATACTEGSSLLNRERPFGLPSKLPGTLYVSSMIREIDALSFLRRKIEKYQTKGTDPDTAISVQSSTNLVLQNDSMDYIFTDPPFGGNLMYSELNFLWEAWLRVFTNNVQEAITNKVQGKGLPEYQRLMADCFKECYRVLKPGRWMTVEFHNSKNSVWNAIQEALQIAGFVIADVRTLDKQQGSFKQVTSASAVKQDLIISCYKPNGCFEERFKLTAGTEEGVWDFTRTHLKQLPVFVSKDGKAEVIAERQNYLLFDRMVAFHVQRGVTVLLSAAEFYTGLTERFPERDGMYFLSEQAAEYDKKRLTVKEVQQLQLFVTDEESSILWLKQQLSKKPQTFQELHPQFLKEIGGWQKHEKPLELSDLLEENFIRYDGKGEVPSQIHSYLSSNYKDLRNLPKDDEALRSKAKDRWYVPDPNKQVDLEKLRERTLLREFEEYRDSKQKRLKVFRLEAVRAGFKKAWQARDYKTIIAVAEKIPEKVLQEDPKLLMWYDQAITRSADT
ncbi:MAG: DNA methylase [Chloroflexi bacterium]|nr:DNA methylase [Chloroflexota bacterium]